MFAYITAPSGHQQLVEITVIPFCTVTMDLTSFAATRSVVFNSRDMLSL